MRLPTLALLFVSAGLAAGLPIHAANHTVRVINNEFSPTNLVIQTGDSVTWTNEGINHNIREINDAFRCANGCDADGGNGNTSSNNWTVTLTFADPGTILYYCEAHGQRNMARTEVFGMSGSIVVEGASTPGSLRFASTPVSVGEGAGSVNLSVQRVGGDDGPASVDYMAVNGSATSPADFTAMSGTLGWADGDDGSKSVMIPIVDDTLAESQESFTVRLTNATGASLGAPNQATVRINDNDSTPPPPPGGGPGQIRLAQEIFEAGEGSGGATVTLERAGGSDGGVSVQLGVAEGTAEEGEDFTPAGQTVAWAAGDAAPKQVTVPILDDGEDEGVELIHLALANPTGGATLADPEVGEVAILDDDGGGDCAITDGETLCLNRDGRFKVQVSFRAQSGDNGRGKIIDLNRDSGLFTFFDPNNAEILVKVLNACGIANHYWVFFAATTNQEFTLTVTDTQNGAVKFYNNAFSRDPAQTVLDIQAFATCP